MKATARTVNTVLSSIAADPTAYNAAATGRVIKLLKPYMVKQKPIKSQYHSINSVEWIEFADENQRKFYNTYYARYLRETESGGNPLTALNKFAQAAEIVRHEQLASKAIEAHKAGYAVLICAKYKDTLVQAMTTLHSKYGVDLAKVSVIWGGIDKNHLNLLEKRKAMREKLTEQEALLLEELDVSDEIAASLCPITSADAELRKRFFKLQDQWERQRNIDAFQDEQTDFCCFTAAAGGVALSLHAHKKTSRPRFVILTPCWSDHQMVQCVGRVDRVTATSDSKQVMICFAGTVEEGIAATFRNKMQGLLKVTGGHDSWVSLAKDAYNRNTLTEPFHGQEATTDGSEDS